MDEGSIGTFETGFVAREEDDVVYGRLGCEGGCYVLEGRMSVGSCFCEDKGLGVERNGV